MRTRILIEKIISKYENSFIDWRDEKEGNRSIRIQQVDYDVNGKDRLISEAKELEEQSLIRVKWFNNKNDMESIGYRLETIPRFYEMLGRTPKTERIKVAQEYVKRLLNETKKSWLRNYYEDVISQLDKGYIPKNIETLWFDCLKGLDTLQEPIYKRIFSKGYLGNSKVFEKLLQTRILSLARKYDTDIDDNMNDSEVLSQLYIEEYSQELAVKGEMLLELEGKKINLAVFPYGTVLNSEMLKHAQLASDQNIHKIITVENKANYMSMQYEIGTLIIYSHGYFSPKERDFLRILEFVLREKEVSYLHTGDLDYGGARIFQYIRTHIFPELKPCRMDLKQYETYIQFGEKIEASTLEKMKELKEELLQPLIDRIIEEKIVIEQESFLYQNPKGTFVEDINL